MSVVASRAAFGTVGQMSGDHATSPFEMLDVGDGHTLRVERHGTPGGIPVVLNHGGPGAGSATEMLTPFDPDRFDIVLYDQRGSGASLPTGELEANATDHLVADLEHIREHFGFDQWVVSGGSWGSTLSLAYATRHPERVSAMLLRGVFLGTRAEVEWIFEDGANRFSPAQWRLYDSLYRSWGDPRRRVDAYLQRIVDPDPAVHLPAARAFINWEASLCTLDGQHATLSDHTYLQFARMEAAYMANDCLLSLGVDTAA